MISLVALLACNTSAEDSSTQPDSIDAIITLVSLNNRPQIEIPVLSYFDYETRLTEEDGSVTIPVELGKSFVITAEENSLVHRYTGIAGNRNLALDALFLDRGAWQSILAYQQIPDEVGVGHLWVAVVNTNFLPIEGASAILTDGNSAEPFVLLQTNIPWTTNSIEPDGKEWIFFANIPSDEVTVSISEPNNLQCEVFPKGSSQNFTNTFTTTIYADTAIILWFMCT